MKKLIFFIVLQILALLSLHSQSVSEYTYKLDNGITVKTERCWNQVWVQQDYSELKTTDKTPLSVSTRTLGDLTSGSSFKLLKAGKEVKMQGAAPGIYDLKLTFKLSGKPGTLSFVVGNVEIKPKTRTSLTITLYDYQIAISESPASNKGLSSFESVVNRYKGNSDQTGNAGIPSFYMKGQHDKAIPPDESAKKNSGKIKPGIYDVLITIYISDETQKVWLENFTMKPDVNYSISTNLNGGVITYKGGNKDVKNMRLYPYGTAAKQTGAPAPVKNSELTSYENVSQVYACRPGSYDVLLGLKNGAKFEWKKNIVVKTGSMTEVK